MRTTHFVRPVFTVIYLMFMLLLAAGAMKLGFWQLDRIDQERANHHKLTYLRKPDTTIDNFSYIQTKGNFLPNSNFSIRQNKPPAISGYAHMAVFRTKQFGDLVVMYDWDQSPTSDIPQATHLEGNALPISLINNYVIFSSQFSSINALVSSFNVKADKYFITSSQYPNIRYFQNLYAPKYGMHYSYALQFFLMGILAILIAGYFFQKEQRNESK